tara:strand:- start:35 stop:196 length:162 start_codon:yes stop_codon:yes gene_type:complete
MNEKDGYVNKYGYRVFDDGNELLMPEYMNGEVSGVSFNEYIRNWEKREDEVFW